MSPNSVNQDTLWDFIWISSICSLSPPFSLWDTLATPGTAICVVHTIGQVKHRCVEQPERKTTASQISLIHRSQRSEAWLAPGGRCCWSERKMLRVWYQSTVAQPYPRTPHGNETSAGSMDKRQNPLRGIIAPPTWSSDPFSGVPSPSLASDPLCGVRTFFHSEWPFTPFLQDARY